MKNWLCPNTFLHPTAASSRLRFPIAVRRWQIIAKVCLCGESVILCLWICGCLLKFCCFVVGLSGWVRCESFPCGIGYVVSFVFVCRKIILWCFILLFFGGLWHGILYSIQIHTQSNLSLLLPRYIDIGFTPDCALKLILQNKRPHQGQKTLCPLVLNHILQTFWQILSIILAKHSKLWYNYSYR